MYLSFLMANWFHNTIFNKKIKLGRRTRLRIWRVTPVGVRVSSRPFKKRVGQMSLPFFIWSSSTRCILFLFQKQYTESADKSARFLSRLRSPPAQPEFNVMNYCSTKTSRSLHCVSVHFCFCPFVLGSLRSRGALRKIHLHAHI